MPRGVHPDFLSERIAYYKDFAITRLSKTDEEIEMPSCILWTKAWLELASSITP